MKQLEQEACDSNAPMSRRGFIKLMNTAGVLGALGLFGCSQPSTSTSAAADTRALELNSGAWEYDSDNDIYYQIGVQYCTNPQAQDYESMGIYVPGAYFTAEDNGDGTFTCTPNASGKVGDYTAETAPIVMPINTAGYAAQAAPTSYNANGITDYLSEGFIYVYAGCRGRNLDDDACGAAPWGVTDLKAAVRTLRYNGQNLPGDMDRIFSFGHSGGGAQSAVLGASGDCDSYSDYLDKIGAPATDASGNPISDAIYGAMCWCPITSLTGADAAYEWNMGQFASSGTRAKGTFTRQLSQDLAAQYATYINGLGLVDEDGAELVLKDGGKGVACKGTYYDYVLGQVELSLNNFLKDTTFPYTPSNSFNADMGAAGGGSGEKPSGEKPSGDSGDSDGAPSGNAPSGNSGDAPSGDAPSGNPPSGEKPSGDSDGAPSGNPPSGEKPSEAGQPGDSGNAPSGEPPSGEAPSGNAPSGNAPSSDSGNTSSDASGKEKQSKSTESTTYATAAEYIESLNGDDPWIKYDKSAKKATITGLAGFVNACKSPSKDVCAFDGLGRGQSENGVFGNEDNESMHFSAMVAELLETNADAYAELSNWDANYPDDYKNDREYLDGVGKTSDERQEMYDPMHFLGKASGAGTSTPAAHWRIRTGITQGDTANTTEINLALALNATSGVEDVDFATVWGQGHTMAERTGSSTENFIAWVNDCCK